MSELDPRWERRLSTCHRDLQRVVRRVHRERMPLMVICGHRGAAEQDEACRTGKSKLRWPDSQHNTTPARAVDLAPLPLNWENVAAFERLARHVAEIAAEEGVTLIWGGLWQMRDLPHFELAKVKF